MRSILTTTLLTIGLLGAPLAAHADLKYTLTNAVAGGDSAGMSMSTTHYVKGMRERIESNMEAGPMHMHNVSLTLCDKHQFVQLDDDLKIYTVGPISGNGTTSLGGAPMPGARPAHRSQGQSTGQQVVTYTVTDKGVEEIHGLKARHGDDAHRRDGMREHRRNDAARGVDGQSADAALS
jgi:hypothetical protein